ncbi:hypothetical protein B6U74_00455 [Candidatus Bathyarchaeota archaeon ex4484_205]|nr:MAG: hypothetical protein B6U74_00455 [Candidatus Bathyarchaeota archaeon ex4484_205]RLG68201.1 MAG: hypothetical protein DRN93_03210 [archaeon]HDN17928.1 hypothetical protein [Candidatus Bathyarchaeota archaeon]
MVESTQKLDEVVELIKLKQKLDAKELESYRKIFGERLDKAIESVKKKRVKKYVFKPSGIVRWIVVGKHKEHIILPEIRFCTCEDSFRQMLDGKRPLCYHLIAQKIAEAIGKYEVIEEKDEMYRFLSIDW